MASWSDNADVAAMINPEELIVIVAPIVAYLAFGDTVRAIAAVMVASVGGGL